MRSSSLLHNRHARFHLPNRQHRSHKINHWKSSPFGGDQATHLVNYSRQEPLTILARIGGQPVKGVNVKIALPESGPGGYFGESRSRTQNLTTNKNGRASIRGFVPNKELGPYIVRVTAHYNGQTATIDVPQRNEWSKTAEAGNRQLRNEIIFAAALGTGLIVILLWASIIRR